MARSTRSVPSSRTMVIGAGTCARQLALRTLDAHDAVGDVDFDRVGQRDGHLADSGHGAGGASVLPDVGQDFAADVQATRPGATHDALRRRQDGGAEAAEDARNRRTRARRRAGPGLLMRLRPIRIGSRPRPPGA